MKINEGDFNAKGLKFQIVLSRFNEFIGSKLLEGCLDGLKRHGADEKNIELTWVPGSFEIPLVAKKLSEKKSADAIICLGCVIKGGTDHYDYVASGMARGIADVATQSGIPVIFGVLTTNTIEQAIERSGTKMGNKGFESAVAAIEMANLMKKI